jgi:hypothetical protein
MRPKTVSQRSTGRPPQARGSRLCEEHTNAPGRSTGKRRCSAMTPTDTTDGRPPGRPPVPEGGTMLSPVPVRRVGVPCCFQPWTATAPHRRRTATHSTSHAQGDPGEAPKMAGNAPHLMRGAVTPADAPKSVWPNGAPLRCAHLMRCANIRAQLKNLLAHLRRWSFLAHLCRRCAHFVGTPPRRGMVPQTSHEGAIGNKEQPRSGKEQPFPPKIPETGDANCLGNG